MIMTFLSARLGHWQVSGNSLLYSPATKFPSSEKSLSTFQPIFQHFFFLVSKKFSFYLQSHYQLRVLHAISLSAMPCPPPVPPPQPLESLSVLSVKSLVILMHSFPTFLPSSQPLEDCCGVLGEDLK